MTNISRELNSVPESDDFWIPPAIRQNREELVARLRTSGRFPQIIDPTALALGDILHIINLESIPKKQLTVFGVHLTPEQDEDKRPPACAAEPHLHALNQPIQSFDHLQNSGDVIAALGVTSMEELTERIRTGNWDRINLGESIDTFTLQRVGLLPLNYDESKQPDWQPNFNIYARAFLVSASNLDLGEK